jgi:MoxR-like ATPase
MGYLDVSDPKAVQEALFEYDKDPQGFLSRYGYAPSTSYLLIQAGKEYPPKAILGVAHKYQFPSLGPLKSSDFSGGENATNRVLAAMNFSVADLSQKIRMLNSLRALKIGSIGGFGRAPHKPLLLLLAIKSAIQSQSRLRTVESWSNELKVLLNEFVPGISTETSEPIWRTESQLWTVELNGEEVRQSAPGEPDLKILSNPSTVAGLTSDFFVLLQDPRIRNEAVEILIDELLVEMSEDQKNRLREMIPEQRTWWVNQGKTYKEERDFGIVWAPLLQKNMIAAPHHSALAEMRVGDIVVHYSKGAVRALGRVAYEAVEKQNPFDRQDNEWQSNGREVGVEYFEIQQPIELDEIKNIPVGTGPFNRNGGVNQGYMFPLQGNWPHDFRLQFQERWPAQSPWGAFSTFKVSTTRIQELASWLVEFRQVEDFASQELDYKIEIFTRVHQSLVHETSDLTSWCDGLKSALTTKNNLVDFRTLRGFLDQVNDEPSKARELVLALTDTAIPLQERIDILSNWDRKNSGSGVKLSVISLLLASIDSTNNPVYNATPVATIFSLIGRRSSKDRASVRYGEFIQLIDELLPLCARVAGSEKIQISNRLEMQSAMWILHKRNAHSSWSTAKQREFLTFVGGDNMPNHLEDLSDEVLLDISFLSEIEELLEDKKQVIFYGPPGAGKTYLALKIAEALSDGRKDKNSVELVQFHPSYAYEDFVEGFRPTESGNFVLKQGKLLSIAQRAKDNPNTKFFLIVDEINRGNLAKIFGEMYFLLEYRDHEIQLQYSDVSFRMPQNLYFIGTMNSADRSIGLIDSALRRRFHFVSFYPTEIEMKDLLRNWLKQNAPEVEWVADVVDRVNSEIDRNFAVGPSHFMKPNLDEALVKKIWNRSVLPYLEDIFFNQESKVKEYELDRLRTLKRLKQDDSAGVDEDRDDDSAAS